MDKVNHERIRMLEEEVKELQEAQRQTENEMFRIATPAERTARDIERYQSWRDSWK